MSSPTRVTRARNINPHAALFYVKAGQQAVPELPAPQDGQVGPAARLRGGSWGQLLRVPSQGTKII